LQRKHIYGTLSAMLRIRLQRMGKPGHAYFRVVVLEHSSRPQGKYLELLGSYDPHKKDMKVKGDRVQYWIQKGAQMSPTANNLFITHSVIQGEKVKAWKPKKKAEAPVQAAPTTAPAV